MSTNPRIRFPGNCARSLALVLGLAAAFGVSSIGGAEFHVAPAPAGDDSNPGLAAKPFASLEKARDAARAANDPAGSTIILAPGIYRRAKTFELESRALGSWYEHIPRYNFRHASPPPTPHLPSISTTPDAGGDGTLVHGNIFLRAGHKAVFNYFGGSDITVSNNLFIDCPLTFGNRIRVQILTNALPATVSIPCPSGLIHFRFFTTFVVDNLSLQA